MNAARPPRLAVWLLRRFGSSPNNAAIIGDLDEQYRRGRSLLWYWRQVLLAIAEGFVAEIRLHKLLAIGALLIGNLFKIVTTYLLDLVARYVARQRHAWETPNLLLSSLVVTILLCAISARIVALLHRPHERATVFAFAAWQFLPSLPLLGFVAAQLSWIHEFGGRLHVILWNTSGATALDGVCGVCTSPSWYGFFLIATSALITVISLLVGSGVLEDESDVQPKHAAI
jgi:hypothetical protein